MNTTRNPELKIDIPLVAAAADRSTLIRQFYDVSVAPDGMIRPASNSFLFLRDETNQIRGGAYVEFTYDICSVYGLWIDSELRKLGHGARIYRAVEDLAYVKKCRRVLLSVFEFQDALSFWKKMGFAVFAELPDCPGGQRLFYMYKQITEEPFNISNR